MTDDFGIIDESLPPLELPARVFDEIDAAKREAESTFVRDCQADIDAATCQECGGPLGDTYTMRNGIRYCSMCASVGGE